MGRFAPSPTGPLHFGSLLAAAASYLQARRHHGRWLVRIEDIDPPREQPGATERILEALERYGFEWDGPVVYQSHSQSAHEAALARLLETPRACPCSGVADGPACGIVELARFSDGMADFDKACEALPATIAGPLLLAVPLLNLACATGAAYRMETDGYALTCSASGVTVDDKAGKPPSAGTVTIRRAPVNAGANPPDWRSRAVSLDAWTTLEALAARTLVPETDASRASGAGPDVADKD